MKNPLSATFSNGSRRRLMIAIVVAVALLIAGLTLVLTRASGFFASVDVSQATVSGNAKLVTQSDGSKAIEFTAPVVTPPPPTTPVTGLKGWQLTPASVGLAPHGLSCASLPEYNGPVSNGNFKPAAGSVISKVRISKSMNLSNGNITIEKSCIKGNGIINNQGMAVTWEPDGCGNQCSPARGPVTIRDSEFDGSALSTQAVAYGCALHGLATLERNYVHDLGSGFCFVNTGDQYSGSMVSNYIHKLRGYGDPAREGSHNETATIRDFPIDKNPSRTALIANNYMDSAAAGNNETGALFIQTLYGKIDNVNVDGNYLKTGGNFALVLEVHGESRLPYGRNMKANNNRLDYPVGGYGPGYVESRGLGYGWAEFKENYKYDASKTDGKGALINL